MLRPHIWIPFYGYSRVKFLILKWCRGRKTGPSLVLPKKINKHTNNTHCSLSSSFSYPLWAIVGNSPLLLVARICLFCLCWHTHIYHWQWTMNRLLHRVPHVISDTVFMLIQIEPLGLPSMVAKKSLALGHILSVIQMLVTVWPSL